MPPVVTTGLESLKKNPPEFLKGKRLGLLANPASVDSGFRHALDIVEDLFPGQLAAIFSPQHGFYAEKQDNMIESAHGIEPRLNIPIYSLYSETRIPTPDMLQGIDTLLVDIQDVGTRVYTFIYTISHCMEVAAKTNRQVVILDRPNPIGGYQVEGNVLEPEWASFVGRFPIPMRHGLTVGETALLFNREFGLDCELAVVPMQGWRRSMYWEDTGLVWIPPSPNLPTPLSCMVYPGQVILEGTNISEGRGTTLPFEQFGAPFLDTAAVYDRVAHRIPGARLRSVTFQPTSGKWQDQACRGFHIHVTDRDLFRPYLASLLLIQAAMALHPAEFQFKEPPYEYEYERLPMDLILGSRRMREQMTDQADLEAAARGWQTGTDDFISRSKAYHLYE